MTKVSMFVHGWPHQEHRYYRLHIIDRLNLSVFIFVMMQRSPHIFGRTHACTFCFGAFSVSVCAGRGVSVGFFSSVCVCISAPAVSVSFFSLSLFLPPSLSVCLSLSVSVLHIFFFFSSARFFFLSSLLSNTHTRQTQSVDIVFCLCVHLLCSSWSHIRSADLFSILFKIDSQIHSSTMADNSQVSPKVVSHVGLCAYVRASHNWFNHFLPDSFDLIVFLFFAPPNSRRPNKTSPPVTVPQPITVLSTSN